jgi:hypothetical protein
MYEAFMRDLIQKNYQLAKQIDLRLLKQERLSAGGGGGGADDGAERESYVSVVDKDVKFFNLPMMGQKERQSIVRNFFKNPEEFVNAIKDARAQDPVYIARPQKELLEEEELARTKKPKQVKGKNKKKKSNKNKGGGQRLLPH